MKKLITMLSVSVLLMGLSVRSAAQTDGRSDIPAGYELVDSVVYTRTASLDSTLYGHNIFNDVSVHQSQGIASAMQNHMNHNSSRTISGYRVRIYFDNSQGSRGTSSSVLAGFKSAHPEYAAYRSYVNPYFKVTVGDFRNRTDAMQLLREIKDEYPSAFIVKENINYPVVDRNHACVADTIKVLRKVNTLSL